MPLLKGAISRFYRSALKHILSCPSPVGRSPLLMAASQGVRRDAERSLWGHGFLGPFIYLFG